ncbi:MAG TPA: hypothetical protein P5186_19000 [Candidatus Paceibacterota bacterium]|nr:hypothetical protein [Candidatus Paceibacterota bacterium]
MPTHPDPQENTKEDPMKPNTPSSRKHSAELKRPLFLTFSRPVSLARAFALILGLQLVGMPFRQSCATLLAADPAIETEVKKLAVDGGIQDGKARLTIEADLDRWKRGSEKVLMTASVRHSIRPTAEKLQHAFALQLDFLQGKPEEVILTLSGKGEVRQVKGEGLRDWSIRKSPHGTRYLVLRFPPSSEPLTRFSGEITGETEMDDLPTRVTPLAVTPDQPAWFQGFVLVESNPALHISATNLTGLTPIESRYLPAELGFAPKEGQPTPQAFRFHGSGYSLALDVAFADPETRRVVLRNGRLLGQFRDQQATFSFQASARIKHEKGGKLELLSGGVALSELPPGHEGKLKFENDRFWLVFDKPGEYPVQLQFHAAIRSSNEWNTIDFRIASASPQPAVFRGLKPDTQFQATDSARPELQGDEFVTYLPVDGHVRLAWKEALPEAEGKLFFAGEMLSQIVVSPGLMRQVALLDFKVMQGELNRLCLLMRGEGEVTRIQGADVLAWSLESTDDPAERRLIIQMNQSQKDHFSLQVQMQTPLGAFPTAKDALLLRPEGATRFTGYFRILNEGAVRLEVTQAKGVSQVSPKQFPATDATLRAFAASDRPGFVYRFSGMDLSLRIQADAVLPELTVSHVLTYHLGETEMTLEGEIELDIREAPLRELLIRVPRGYAIAKLSAGGMTDYFLREIAESPGAELRLVYGQPVTGRQVIQLQMERNQALQETSWLVPRIEVLKTKSVRGQIGIAADAGIRLVPEKNPGLTEVATAFFPKKLPNLQAAFRVSDPQWQINLQVERLPQSIQVDAFHLFSIGEGIAYGSSVLNYLISGAPTATLKVQLADEYFNVEFTGKDIRNWKKTPEGYQVQLHTPVAGPYTLLATYERPFKSQGDTLSFTGARPLDARSEQGHTLVISVFQFQVRPDEVSPGLLPLETGEVPAEYRLLFDAPILAAYRYNARPFNLRLALKPLTQGETLSQVVDRASLVTRISQEGQVLTEARYFVKNRGQPHFRVTLPEGIQLWSTLVNGVSAVPVTMGQTNFVPLPQRNESNAVLTVELKLATRSKNPTRIAVRAPVVDAPILLADWKFEADAGHRLIFRRGSLQPAGGILDPSGFGGLAHLFTGSRSRKTGGLIAIAFALWFLAGWMWRWASRPGTYKYSPPYLAGSLLGMCAFIIGAAVWVDLMDLARHQPEPPPSLAFTAPVQQSGTSLAIEVSNLPETIPTWARILEYWPFLFAIFFGLYSLVTSRTWLRPVGMVLAWLLVFWTCLRSTRGTLVFLALWLLFLLVRMVVPSIYRLAKVPRKPKAPPAPPSVNAAAMAAIAGALFLFQNPAQAQRASDPPIHPLADSVVHQIKVQDQFAFATVRITWQAEEGAVLPVIFSPAVLTRIEFPTNQLQWLRSEEPMRRGYSVLAKKSGRCEIELQYQLPVNLKHGIPGVTLPAQHGLVNQATLTLAGQDVEVISPQAVSLEPARSASAQDTVVRMVLTPSNESWIGWKPRSRDVRREKAVIYAELVQLYAPSAGIIEGAHWVQVRPAQGEVSELILEVPSAVTVTDVNGLVGASLQEETKSAASGRSSTNLVALWRFDPDNRKLRVTLQPPQARPFAIQVQSQVSAGPLPLDHRLGLLSVSGAARQIGLIGIATGSEVQLDDIKSDRLSAINLEDFPVSILQALQAQTSGLTLHRAFRYDDIQATASIRASSVESDVRIETQQTLSLGEDRILLAANVSVQIARAGIFRLSFSLPTGMDVESISGPSLSHWTELKEEGNRWITLHLQGRTEGRQQFAIHLAGPGIKSAGSWTVPRLSFREAGKQQGQLVLAPEQGMRLQTTLREGLIPLDPEKAGLRQKGVLAFRLLQDPWQLALDIEQVDSWIQTTSLQHVIISEAQIKTAANLQYQIENTGLKSLRIRLPADADNVRFQGDQVADFLPIDNTLTNGLQSWEVKLHRRIIGPYLLQVTYQNRIPEAVSQVQISGIQAEGVNLQRGFLTVQSSGRLQIRSDSPPPTLQTTDWQSIPRALRQSMPADSANFSYRLVEPDFQLILRLERHESAKLLAARVERISLTSVISDDGNMLTQVRLDLVPGDKRLLHLTLPEKARFWFAFLNQNSTWPWKEDQKILLPLEQNVQPGRSVAVEFFYSTQALNREGNGRFLDLELLGPKFDLPLENITWRVFLGDKWELRDWKGTLQLHEDKRVRSLAVIDDRSYLMNEINLRQEKTKEAEQMLQTANTLLEQGDPQQARQAFQAAFGMSRHDYAFNEDARVQLHNLKLQQALVGLNYRQAAFANDADSLATRLRDLKNRKGMAYTQEEARQIIDRKTADENSAFLRLAERLVQQQDAAISAPVAIRASIPEQGRQFTFSRAIQVDTWADMNLTLSARAKRPASSATRLTILAAVALGIIMITWISRRRVQSGP